MPARRLMAGAVVAVLGLAAVAFCEGFQFDDSRYRPARLAEVVAQHPPRPALEVVPDVPIRCTVTYAGRFRDISEDTQRLVKAWSQAMNVPGMLDTFKREVQVREDATEYWLPVQETLVSWDDA